MKETAQTKLNAKETRKSDTAPQGRFPVEPSNADIQRMLDTQLPQAQIEMHPANGRPLSVLVYLKPYTTVSGQQMTEGGTRTVRIRHQRLRDVCRDQLLAGHSLVPITAAQARMVQP